jgi:CheY-like chemotaxis protein/tRNA A-37 threonylcarbamoyl transferase component Bud32
LSVDDEPVNQEVINAMFEDSHHMEVINSMTGFDALEILETSHVDIVLLDLMMPGMSGLEVLMKIRRNPKVSHVPVVMVSAKNQGDVISDALWKGATDFFVKPLDNKGLLARIDKILSRTLKEQPDRTQALARTSDSGTPNSSTSTVYSVLALAFAADSQAALQLLEIVFTYVERTAEQLAAERTCRSPDGSMLIIAEGKDSEARLRRVEHEIRAWFQENVGAGLRMSIGISAPSQLYSDVIGEQFVALGTCVSVATLRALHSSHGSLLPEASVPSSEMNGLRWLDGATDKPSDVAVAQVPEQWSSLPGGEVVFKDGERRVNKAEIATVEESRLLGVVRNEVLRGSLAQAELLYRMQRLLRAECKKYETRLALLSKELRSGADQEWNEAATSEVPALALGDKDLSSSANVLGVGEIRNGDRADSEEKSSYIHPNLLPDDLPVAPPGVLPVSASVKKSSRLAKMKEKIGINELHGQPEKSDNEKHYEANYVQMEALGTGSSSTVYRSLQKSTGKYVAVKRRKKTNEEVLSEVKQEFDVLRLCRHSGVVVALDVIGEKLILELLIGPTLQEVIEETANGISENVARPICKQLVEVVFYLHQKGVCHRDIKPGNLILVGSELDAATLKLIDFNTACFYDRMATVTGTVAFMAPEILKGWDYDEKIDVYSVGVTTFMMLTNVMPCNEDEDSATNDPVMFVKQKMSGSFAEMDCMSPQARSFVQLTLIAENKSRPTARTLIAHMWLHEDG